MFYNVQVLVYTVITVNKSWGNYGHFNSKYLTVHFCPFHTDIGIFRLECRNNKKPMQSYAIFHTTNVKFSPLHIIAIKYMLFHVLK